MITICFVLFRSLTLVNFAASLFSVRKQNLSLVDSIIILDNDTEYSSEEIETLVNAMSFPVPVDVWCAKHGDRTKTHAWSTNAVVRDAHTPWVLFTRADYLLDFSLIDKFTEAVKSPMSFVTSDFFHLNVDIAQCETTDWKVKGLEVLQQFPGRREDYSQIDSGVWMTRRELFDLVGGLDERLTAWGHAQTHFQYKLFNAGVEFMRVPEVLFYHPYHAAQRDLSHAHRQLESIGGDIKQMWSRYDGRSPY